MNALTQHIQGPSIRDDLLAILPRLRRYALSLTGNLADADDLLHSTVERALERADQFAAGTDLDRWMFRICRNLWMDEIRARKVRGSGLAADEDMPEAWMDGEGHVHSTIELKRLGVAISGLEEDYRAVLMLIVVEGYSYKEAAGHLDIPIGTVMSRLARARQKLAALMPVPPEGANIVTLSGAKRKKR